MSLSNLCVGLLITMISMLGWRRFRGGLRKLSRPGCRAFGAGLGFQVGKPPSATTYNFAASPSSVSIFECSSRVWGRSSCQRCCGVELSGALRGFRFELGFPRVVDSGHGDVHDRKTSQWRKML